MVARVPIRVNTSDSFPGAQSAFIPPVVKGDCCLFQDVQSMMAHASEQGWPATVKGGVAYVKASLAQIQGVCLIGVPNAVTPVPDPIVLLQTWNITGFLFGIVEGEVWLGSAATWAGSGTKVQQNVNAWSWETISMFQPVQGGLPLSPAHVYLYVINDCGQRNPVGTETELFELPP
ncbi:hypothetical protein ES703_99013 [subsurface metagenome]